MRRIFIRGHPPYPPNQRSICLPTSRLEQGAKGTTGTVYDLDPDSITAG